MAMSSESSSGRLEWVVLARRSPPSTALRSARARSCGSAEALSSPRSRILASPFSMRSRHMEKLSARRFRAGSEVIGEFARERSQRASLALCGLIEPKDDVAPSLEGRQRIQRLQMGPLRVENALGLSGDHVEHQRVLIREVVIELRFAHAARRHHVVEARLLHAMRIDQIGCGLDDTRPGRRASGGQRARFRFLICGHENTLHQVDLTVQMDGA